MTALSYRFPIVPYNCDILQSANTTTNISNVDAKTKARKA